MDCICSVGISSYCWRYVVIRVFLAMFIMLGIAGTVELEPNSYFTGWKVLQLSLSFVIAICLAYTGAVAVNKEG